jgi:hypothetical protein
MTIGANDFASSGYALVAKITYGDGTATVFANTPAAIALVSAVTVLAVGAMLSQGRWLPQVPQLARAEGDDDKRLES